MARGSGRDSGMTEVAMQSALIRRTFIICTLLLGLVLASLPAAAQTGQVRGKVVDAKNQPVDGATVTIEATDGMGRRFVVKTNRRGEYVQIGLPPGQYKLTAEKDKLSQSFDQRVGLDAAEVNFTLTATSAAASMSPEDRKKAEERVASVKANFAAGVAATNAGNFDEAIAKFNAVLAEAPKCSECYLNIASVHLRKKEYDQAEAMYKKSLEINPNASEAYNGLASVYNAQKKFDQAAEASAMASKLGAAAGGGGNASAVFNQGVIAWNASKIPEAKKAFAEAVKLDPTLADAHYWLGMANLNEGNMAEAATAFEEYLKLAPSGQYAEQAKGVLAQIKK
jgi:tetratricopeptide (TPR) repeat protein